MDKTCIFYKFFVLSKQLSLHYTDRGLLVLMLQSDLLVTAGIIRQLPLHSTANWRK